MKFLLITEFFPTYHNPIFWGGVEVRAYYIAKYLHKKHQVMVIARRRPWEQSVEQRGKLTIYRHWYATTTQRASLRSLPFRAWFVLWAIYKALGIKADMVEGSNYVTFFPAFFLGYLKNIPTIAYYPDVLIGNWGYQFGLLIGYIGEMAERIFVALPWSQVITISKPAHDRLRKVGISRQKIHIVPCGVDIKSITRVKKIPRKKQLIIVSRLVRYKRVDWGIRLMAELQGVFAEYKLLIIGKGPELERLQMMIANRNLQERITLKSSIPQQELYQDMYASQLLLHPSVVEGFGIVLAEAAALGTPFVAADIPTSKELRQSLGSGVVFKSQQFSDFVTQTKTLLTNKHLWHTLHQQGRQHAAKYNWETITKQAETCYLEIMRGDQDPKK